MDGQNRHRILEHNFPAEGHQFMGNMGSPREYNPHAGSRTGPAALDLKGPYL